MFAGSNLTVTHERLDGADLSVTAFTDGGAVIPYQPVIRSISNTVSIINFVDAAGAFVAVADTKMSLIFTKRYQGPISLDGTGNGVSLDLDLGNMWIYGIFGV